MDLNKAVIMGNVGKDPDYHAMKSGDELCKFSVATSRKWRDKTTLEMKEDTNWHNVVVFNKYIVKVCKQFVQKGTRVYIEGEIKTRSYEKDGEKKYITEFIVPSVKGELIIIAKGKGWDEDKPRHTSDQPDKKWVDGYEGVKASPPPGGFDDDIPF